MAGIGRTCTLKYMDVLSKGVPEMCRQPYFAPYTLLVRYYSENRYLPTLSEYSTIGSQLVNPSVRLHYLTISSLTPFGEPCQPHSLRQPDRRKIYLSASLHSFDSSRHNTEGKVPLRTSETSTRTIAAIIRWTSTRTTVRWTRHWIELQVWERALPLSPLWLPH